MLLFSGHANPGWDFFPWNVWRKVKPTKATILKQVVELPRSSRQTNLNKEIIDLEETVCLPRYQCGRQSSNDDPTKPFTDTVNENNVIIFAFYFCFFTKVIGTNFMHQLKNYVCCMTLTLF
jgi:hypothetical protein